MKDKKKRKTPVPSGAPLYVGKANLDMWNLWRTPAEEESVGSPVKKNVEEKVPPDPSISPEPK